MAELLASFPMYDWPEVRGGYEVLWARIAEHLCKAGIPAPKSLSHTTSPFEHWRSPDLLISQTCGWPYANRLRETVIPFARFDHGLASAPAGVYNSVFIAPKDANEISLGSAQSLLDCPAIAINGEDSQSGFHVFSERLQGNPASQIPEANRIITGSHRNSIHTVSQGRAKLAAIDAVSFELAKAYEPAAVADVAVLDHSEPRAALPLVTAKANAALVSVLYAAVEAAVGALEAETRTALCIHGVLPAKDADYASFVSSQNV